MNIGISLSTLKDYISDNKSFLDTSKLLKDMGYSHLGYISFHFDLYRIKKELEQVNLPFSLIMFPLDKVLNEALKIMKDLKETNCNRIMVESFPLDVISNPKKLKQIIKSLDEVSKIYSQNGFNICYHFKTSDFIKLEDKTMVDYINDNTKYIKFIFDPFSVVQAGLDIEEYLIKFKNKVEIIFIDDYQIQIDNNELVIHDTLVGLGNINYKKILPILKKYPCKNYMVYNSFTKNQFMKIKDCIDIVEKWK